MKKILFTLIAVASFAGAYAQAGVQLRNDGFSATTNQMFTELRKKKATEVPLGTVGSPYIDESFAPCEVFYNDELVGTFYYRHNAVNDEIEIKDSPLPDAEISSLATMRQLRIVDKKSGQEISMQTFETKEDQLRNGYLYAITGDGNYQLYQRNKVKFTEGTEAVSSYVRSQPNRFSIFTDYYYSDKDGKIVNFVPTRKGAFISSFDKSIQSSLKEYMKEEGLNVKKEEDLIQIIEFLNQQGV